MTAKEQQLDLCPARKNNQHSYTRHIRLYAALGGLFMMSQLCEGRFFLL